MENKPTLEDFFNMLMFMACPISYNDDGTETMYVSLHCTVFTVTVNKINDGYFDLIKNEWDILPEYELISFTHEDKEN